MDQTLITKYRPDSFDLVIGNSELVKKLQDVVRSSLRPHGYLLTGNAGIGKTTLARIIAKELNASITEIDAASYSGVDDTRQIVEASGFTSIMLQQNRLYLIDECHALSSKAWNPLLKLIEDPPQSVYVALCTTDPKTIPETIKTRCFPVPLRPLKSAEIQELVSLICELEGWIIHNDIFMPIVMASEGSARKALNILQAGYTAQSVDELSKIIDSIESDNDSSIALCKYLMSGKRDWRPIQKYLSEIENYDSALQNISRYLTGAIGRSEEKQAEALWEMLFKFTMDVSWDKKVQLYRAIGAILWYPKLPF